MKGYYETLTSQALGQLQDQAHPLSIDQIRYQADQIHQQGRAFGVFWGAGKQVLKKTHELQMMTAVS